MPVAIKRGGKVHGGGPSGGSLIVPAMGVILLVCIFLFARAVVSDSGPGALQTPRKMGRRGPRELLAAAQRAETYKQWAVRDVNPYAQDKQIRCFNPAIDVPLAAGMALVNSFIEGDQSAWRNVQQLNQSLSHFYEAIHASSQCPVPVLNAVIVATFLEMDALALNLAERAVAMFPRHAGLHLWAGFLVELRGDLAQAQKLYRRAIEFGGDEYALDFFGVHTDVASSKELSFFQFNNPNPEAVALVRRTLRSVLFAREFAQYFGANPMITREEAMQWPGHFYFFVRRLHDPYTLSLLTATYRQLIAMGALTFKDPQAIRYVVYNDPLARFMSASTRRIVSRITDMPLKPTYTYFGGYVGSAGSELKPHTDRSQCEFTVSMNLDTDPIASSCPISLNPHLVGTGNKDLAGSSGEMPKDPKQIVTVYPRPGDALLFKGRHLVHWRTPIPVGTNCSNVFMHFVHDSFEGTLN